MRTLLFLDLVLSLFCFRWLSLCTCARALLVHVRVGVGVETTNALMGLRVEVRAVFFLGLALSPFLFSLVLRLRVRVGSSCAHARGSGPRDDGRPDWVASRGARTSLSCPGSFSVLYSLALLLYVRVEVGLARASLYWPCSLYAFVGSSSVRARWLLLCTCVWASS